MNKALEDFKKEQEELSIKLEKESSKMKEVNQFLQNKFNERYIGRSILIIIPIAILCGYFILYTNIFNDGFLRFLIAMTGVTFLITIIKNLVFRKLKKEFNLGRYE